MPWCKRAGEKPVALGRSAVGVSLSVTTSGSMCSVDLKLAPASSGRRADSMRRPSASLAARPKRVACCALASRRPQPRGRRSVMRALRSILLMGFSALPEAQAWVSRTRSRSMASRWLAVSALVTMPLSAMALPLISGVTLAAFTPAWARAWPTCSRRSASTLRATSQEPANHSKAHTAVMTKGSFILNRCFN